MKTRHLLISLTLVAVILLVPYVGKTGIRYKQNGNGSVLDVETNLEWQQNYSLGHDWKSAVDYCKSIDLAGNSDWRLPNLKELGSIVDPQRKNPSIDTRTFNATSDRYWTSSTEGNNEAWLVYFDSGLSGFDTKSTNINVRCVRNR